MCLNSNSLVIHFTLLLKMRCKKLESVSPLVSIESFSIRAKLKFREEPQVDHSHSVNRALDGEIRMIPNILFQTGHILVGSSGFGLTWPQLIVHKPA